MVGERARHGYAVEFRRELEWSGRLLVIDAIDPRRLDVLLRPYDEHVPHYWLRSALITGADGAPKREEYLSPAGFVCATRQRRATNLRSEELASRPPASWNQIIAWLRQIEALRQTT